MRHAQKLVRPFSGIHPFWFWNGAMEDSEIRRQIGEMADQGVDGFFIHPRQGMELPYLSEAFFDKVALAIEEAEKKGLAVHLYDEYPYPSGIAGGFVTEGTPAHMATALEHINREFQDGTIFLELPRGRVLSCTAFPVAETPQWDRGIDLLPQIGMLLKDHSFLESGLTRYNQKRYFASRPVPVLKAQLPEGRWLISASVQTLITGFKYWGYYVDHLNPDAMDEFLNRTHENYSRRFKALFGKSVFSIFTDETEPGWSTHLPVFFRERCGYDLIPLLPALGNPGHPGHRQVKRDFADTRYALFCSTFEEKIGGWCRNHNILYSGEKPSFTLSQLAYMDIPGCDPGHTKAGAMPDLLLGRIRRNARAVASAAFFYGKESSLCECFHSLGWSGTLLDERIISEALLLLGIGMLVPHGYFYTTHSLAKHDAPPTFFFQMPYWFMSNRLFTRIHAIQKKFEDTAILPDLLVYDPSAGLPTEAEQEWYSGLLYRLMSLHIEFLIVDREILSDSVLPESMHTLPLLVPPMDCPEKELESALSLHEKRGGVTYRFSDDRSPASADLGEVLRQLTQEPPLFRSEKPCERLWVVKRRREGADGKRLWFFLNTSDSSLTLDFSGDVHLTETPLDDSGAVKLLENRREVAPFESFLLEESDSEADAPAATPAMEVAIPEKVSVHIHSENLLRLDEWTMNLSQFPEYRRTVHARPFANQLAEGNLPLAPKVNFSFGSQPELEVPDTQATYRTSFEVSSFHDRIKLVMEPGSLRGEWSLRVNGSAPLTVSDFSESSAHIRGSLERDITALLKEGLNEIEATVRIARRDDGLVNPLYLAGQFGVYFSGNPELPRLAPLPDEGSFEKYAENGLPYFSGTLEYRFTAPLKLPPTPGSGTLPEKYRLIPRFPADFQEAAEIRLNTGPKHPLPWIPYETEIASGEVRDGLNEISLTVHTSLIRSFEGEYFDVAAHSYRDCRKSTV